MKKLMLKLMTMRKEQEFVVYPKFTDSPELIQIQSDKAIARFNQITGKGMINYKGSNSKYGVHLQPHLGAVPFQASQELIDQCLDCRPRSGDKIGNGVYVA